MSLQGVLSAGGGRLVMPLIAVMSFLTALALAGGLLLADAASGLGRSIGRDATVQIVEANPDRAAPQVRAVLALLAKDHDVASVRAVPQAEVERLLEPWLGAEVSGDLLPLPRMIDLTLKPQADAASLAKRVRAAAPAARLDVQARWLAPLAGLIGSLGWLAGAIILAVAVATAAVVALGTRSGLGVHRPTIDLLHVMGAEDGEIARVFQHRFLLHGLIGGAIGVGCAVAAMVALASGVAELGLGSPPVAAWLLLALVPVAAGLLAALVARVSVGRALREQL